jgi:hypothetical protein
MYIKSRHNTIGEALVLIIVICTPRVGRVFYEALHQLQEVGVGMMQVIMSRELPLHLVKLLWLQVQPSLQILGVMNYLALHLFQAVCAP